MAAGTSVGVGVVARDGEAEVHAQANARTHDVGLAEELQRRMHAQARAFPIIPCNLCGSQENLQRKVVGEMLAGWEREHPGRLTNIARALTRVSPSHLMDPALFDFASLSVTPAEGDRGFDPDDYPQREFLSGVQELDMLG